MELEPKKNKKPVFIVLAIVISLLSFETSEKKKKNYCRCFIYCNRIYSISNQYVCIC